VGNPEYRYMVPMWPFALVAVGWVCDRSVAQAARAGRGGMFAAAMPVALGVWLFSHTFPLTVQLLEAQRTVGTGYYSTPRFRDSQVFQYLATPGFQRLTEGSTRIYSNAPDAVYWKSRRTAYPLPGEKAVQQGADSAFHQMLQQAAQGGKVVLVTIFKQAVPPGAEVALGRELAAAFRVPFQVVQIFADRSGVVFLARPIDAGAGIR
jgi:hypothetical protein